MGFLWREGLKGLLLGVVLGATGGLGVCVWLIDGTLLFPGHTMLFGAILFGVLGFLYGESYFEWFKERWYWFLGWELLELHGNRCLVCSRWGGWPTPGGSCPSNTRKT